MNDCIYLSDWTPRGVRKEWDRCSISVEDAARIIGAHWIDGKVIDACAWFSSDDALKVMAVDTDAGKRIIYRRTKRNTTIEMGRKP